MVALGLLLLVAACLLTVGVVVSNTTPQPAEFLFVTLANVSLGSLFLVGVVTGIAGTLGLMLMLGGSVRRRHKKVEAKREQRTVLEENARLQRELEQQREARAYPNDPHDEAGQRRGAVGR